VGADLEVLARQIWLYMLANVHYQIVTGEVVSPPDRFWYYLRDLLYGIQNAAETFQLKLEHLVGREAPRGVILSGAVGTDVPSLRNFLEVLSRYGLEYDSDNVDYFSPSRECFFINDRAAAVDAPDLTPPDLSPTSHAAYLNEKDARLQSWQVDLDATEADLKRTREEME